MSLLLLLSSPSFDLELIKIYFMFSTDGHPYSVSADLSGDLTLAQYRSLYTVNRQDPSCYTVQVGALPVLVPSLDAKTKMCGSVKADSL